MEVVKQLGYLYDSNGLIDKHNNVYYNPFGVLTAKDWFDKFTNKASYNEDYLDIDLSSWSPEDRVVRVKGQIDTFRNFTTGALILNYLIIKRLDENNNIKSYVAFFIDSVRQAGVGSVELSISPDYFTNTFFFNIEGVEPFNSTIKNAYIERQHYNRVKKYNEAVSITSTSEFSSEVNYILDLTKIYNLTPPSVQLTNLVYYLFFGNDTTKVTIKKKSSVLYQGAAPYIEFCVDEHQEKIGPYVMKYSLLLCNIYSSSDKTTLLYNFSIDYSDLSDNTFEFTVNPNYPFTTGSWTSVYFPCITNAYFIGYDNLDLFANVEETFKYRYQYKDLKSPLTFKQSEVVSFSKEEEEIINATEDIFELNATLIHKIMKSCLYWYIVLCKKSLTIPYQINTNDDSTETWYGTITGQYAKLTKNVNSNLQYLAIPFIKIPKMFEKYSAQLNKIYINNVIACYSNKNVSNPSYDSLIYDWEFIPSNNARDTFYQTYFYTSFLGSTTANDVLSVLISLYGSYIQSIYCVKDINASYRCEYDINEQTLTIYVNSTILHTSTYASSSFASLNVSESLINGWISTDETTIAKYMSVSGFYPSGDYVYPKLTITKTNIKCTNSSEVNVVFPVFILNGQNFISNNITLSDNINKDYKSEYIETLLTFEPYQYFSLSSYGNNEVILNKARYYQSYEKALFNINVDYGFSLVGSLQLSYIINYEVNGIELPYFNDSLIFSVNCSIPFMNEKYFEYLYQNMAMMKTQVYLEGQNGIENLTLRATNMPLNIMGGGLKGISKGTDSAMAGMGVATINEYTGMVGEGYSTLQNIRNTKEQQKAQQSGVASKPNSLKEMGSEIITQANTNELCCYLNHYTIDDLSYNSISKFLERFGYEVNIYDTLNVSNRIGWNYIKLVSLDIVKPMSLEQENSIRNIFKNGVTLLHNPEYLTDDALHNYETKIDE